MGWWLWLLAWGAAALAAVALVYALGCLVCWAVFGRAGWRDGGRAMRARAAEEAAWDELVQAALRLSRARIFLEESPSAGKGAGFDDERHLWPAWFWLVEKCRPGTIFGEQVAGKDGEAWFDLVSSDLEGVGYACGASVVPACGVGAPHLRKRLYWVADAGKERRQRGWAGETSRSGEAQRSERLCDAGGVGDGERAGLEGQSGGGDGGDQSGREALALGPVGPAGVSGGVGVADGGFEGEAGEIQSGWEYGREPEDGGALRADGAGSWAGTFGAGSPGPVNGFWGGADWLGCRDGKFRPVEPGTFPLADGYPDRVVGISGYGNAIVAPQAVEFVRAFVATRR